MIWEHQYPPGYLAIAAAILVAMSANAAALTVRDAGGVQPGTHPGTALALAVAALAGVLAVTALLPRWRMWALRGVALATLCAALLAAWSPHVAAANTGVPWILHLGFVGMVAAAVCMRAIWLTLYSVLMLASQWQLSTPTASSVSLLVVVAIGVGALAFVKGQVLTVVAATRHANRRAAAASLERTRATAADAAADQRNAWVHDHLLVVLRLGSQRSPAAAELAGELAASGLNRPEAGPSDLRRSAREVAAGQGVRLRWDLASDGEAPPEILTAIDRAIGEAIRNAARHSGAGLVSVAGEVLASGAHVTVTDAGCGFEPGRTGENHLGIRTSILAQLEGVGGWAEVLSESGAGTQVRLGWRPSPDPDPRLDVPLGGVVVATAGMSAAAAVRALSTLESGDAGWVLSGFAAVILLTAVVTFRPRASAPALLAWLVAGTALVLTAPAGGDVESRNWLALGSAVLFVAVARVRRERLGLVLALTGFLANVLFAALLRPGDVATGLVYWAQPVIYAALAWAGIAQFERLLRDYRDASQRAIVLEATVIRAQAERDEAERWRVGMPALVLPLLEELATTPAIGTDLARRCALAEAATRDYLTAPRLVTPELAGLVASLREAGAYVSLTDGGPRTPAGELRAVRTALQVVAPLAAPGSRLTVRPTVNDPACFATLTVTGPRPDEADRLAALPEADVFTDADTIQVRLLTGAPDGRAVTRGV